MSDKERPIGKPSGGLSTARTAHTRTSCPSGIADQDGALRRQRVVSWSEVDVTSFPGYFRRGRPCISADGISAERWTSHQLTLDADPALDRYEELRERRDRGDLIRDLALVDVARPSPDR